MRYEKKLLRSVVCVCVCVASSAVVWEGRDKKKQFRALTSKLSDHLEECYSQYLVSLQTDHSARMSRVLQNELNFDVIRKTLPSSNLLSLSVQRCCIKLGKLLTSTRVA